jgi:hypothetical protein
MTLQAAARPSVLDDDRAAGYRALLIGVPLHWKVLMMAGVVAAAVFWTLIFTQFTVDDAYICFR